MVNVRCMSDAELERYALNVMASDDYDPRVVEVRDLCESADHPETEGEPQP